MFDDLEFNIEELPEFNIEEILDFGFDAELEILTFGIEEFLEFGFDVPVTVDVDQHRTDRPTATPATKNK